MQVLRLLAAPRPRRGVSTTVTAPTTASPDDSKAVDDDEEEECDDDGEGSFFELDLSVRASSSSSSTSSGSSDDASLTDLDLVISLHRSRSSSPSFHFPAPPPLLKPPGAGITPPSSLRTLSFARATTASASGTRSNAGRRSSFARSVRSLRLSMESPASPADDEDPEREPRPAPSRDVIRRYLTKISTRLRRSVRPRTRRGGDGVVVGLRRLRKSRSASAAATTTTATPPAASRRDDSLAEKQDGIASAIAHCKESLHRASLSECGLPRSRSEPQRGSPHVRSGSELLTSTAMEAVAGTVAQYSSAERTRTSELIHVDAS